MGYKVHCEIYLGMYACVCNDGIFVKVYLHVHLVQWWFACTLPMKSKRPSHQTVCQPTIKKQSTYNHVFIYMAPYMGGWPVYDTVWLRAGIATIRIVTTEPLTPPTPSLDTLHNWTQIQAQIRTQKQTQIASSSGVFTQTWARCSHPTTGWRSSDPILTFHCYVFI